MNKFKILFFIALVNLVLPLFQPFARAENHAEHPRGEAHGHQEKPSQKSDHDKSAHEEGGREDDAIHLTPEQLKMGGIVVEKLQPTRFSRKIRAPGEIQLNAYATSRVVPRISAQLLSRKARLGDEVKKDQVLVVLSSVEMAEAQGELLVADREWQRVKKLGRDVVAEQRYTKAKVLREQMRAKVLAYGMTQAELAKLLANGNAAQADGHFKLLSKQHGTVIRDDFILGERVQPGRVLFEISDESVLWVEARLPPDQATGIKVNTPATIIFQKQPIEGKVVQVHHALDESTRTLAVRIEIPNPDDRLHPGLFVETQIQGSPMEQVLAVPTDAVLRSPDGDWQVFIERGAGQFEAVEVNVGQSSDGMTVIEGLEPGTNVVTKGAFFLQSEAAKSGFDVHQH